MLRFTVTAGESTTCPLWSPEGRIGPQYNAHAAWSGSIKCVKDGQKEVLAVHGCARYASKQSEKKIEQFIELNLVWLCNAKLKLSKNRKT